jgi:hemolysin activation/secretion protein
LATKKLLQSTLTLSLVLSSALLGATTPDSGSITIQNKSEKNIPQSLPSKAQRTGIAISAVVVVDGTAVLDAPSKSGKLIKVFNKNDEIQLNGILKDGYYELQDGGYIQKDSVKILSKISNVGVSHRGEVRMKNSLIEKTFANYTKDALTADNLDSGLSAVKNLGAIDAAVFLKPNGKDYDATLGVVEAKPFSGYLGVDNYGDHSTGVIRTSLGASSNDALGYGERVSASFVSTGQNLLQGSLQASLPVNSDSSSASLGASKMRYKLGDSFKALEATGSSTSIWAAYNKPLWLSFQGQANYNVRVSNNKMVDEMHAFSTTTYRASNTIDNALSFVQQDEYMGGGTNGAFFDFKLGKLVADSSNDPYKKVGSYAKANLELQRAQKLGSFVGIASLKTQKAFRNLDSSEKFNITGMDAVGGYYSGDIVGDEGYLVSLELLRATLFINNLTGSLVYATGAVKTLYSPIDGSNNIQKASSAGAKLSYAAPYDVAASMALYKRTSGELANNYDSPYHFYFNLSKKF